MIYEKHYQELTKSQHISIVSIYLKCFNSPPQNEGWTSLSASQFIRNASNHGTIFLFYTESDHLAAFATLQPSTCSKIDTAIKAYGMQDEVNYLSILAIDPKNQSNGIGTKLLSRIIQYSKEKGLALRCRHDNSIMIYLAKKMGMKKIHSETTSVGTSRCKRFIFLLKS